MNKLFHFSLLLFTSFVACADEAVVIDATPTEDLPSIVARATRAARTAGPGREVDVRLAPGEYRLSEPLEIVGADVDAGIARVTYRSADRLHPAVVTGGRVVDGWTVGTDGVWRVTLPDVKAGKLDFAALYANGVRRYRPRVPETGWFESVAATRVPKDKEAGRAGGFTYAGDVLRPDWANRDDLEVFMLLRWNSTRLRVAEINADRREVVLKAPYRGRSHLGLEGRRFCIENVKEAFSRPGQWYLDRPTGVLAYRPYPGETPANTKVEIPVASRLLSVASARNVTFRDLVFRLDNVTTPEGGSFSSQAAVQLGAAVEVSDAENVAFEGCVFVNLGAWAVAFRPKTANCRVSACVLRDFGAGGVRIGSADRTDVTGITVEDCEISEGGRIAPGGPAILAVKASHGRFLRNHIHDMYYTGISVGWGWKVEETPSSSDNEIASNHIHDLGLRQLSDMGLVYLLCRQPGTRVHHNLLHDITHYEYGSTGIYPDECSAHEEFDHNVVLRTGRSFHSNMVRDLHVHHNVFVDGDLLQWDFSNNLGEEENLLHLHHNTFVWTGGRLARRRKSFTGDKAALAAYAAPFWQGLDLHDNVYWRRDGRPDVFSPADTFPHEYETQTLAAFQSASGQERNSVYRDPGAIDFDAVTGPTGVASNAVHAVWRMPATPRPMGYGEQYVLRRAARELTVRDGIGTVLGKLTNGTDVTVAYFGGSITEGTSWRPAVTAWMRETFPKSRIREINAGIGGTGSDLAVYRCAEDVLRHRPDLVFVEFACNDMETPESGVGANVEELVRQIWRQDPRTDIVFLYTVTRQMREDYALGVLPRVAAIHDTVAEQYHVPSVCFAPRVMALDRAGRLAWTAGDFPTAVPKEDPAYDRKVGEAFARKGVLLFSNDSVHPRAEGGKLYFQAITNLFAQPMPRPCIADREGFVTARPFSLDPIRDPRVSACSAVGFKGAWRKVGADEESFAKFLKRTGSLWLTDTPGDSYEFTFVGQSCSTYALLGPSGARLEVTVDGRRQPNRDLCDKYSSYWRLMRVPLFDGAWGTHHVVLTVSAEQPDRTCVQRCRKLSDERMRSGEFDGHRAVLGRLFLEGELK